MPILELETAPSLGCLLEQIVLVHLMAHLEALNDSIVSSGPGGRMGRGGGCHFWMQMSGLGTRVSESIIARLWLVHSTDGGGGAGNTSGNPGNGGGSNPQSGPST